MSYLLLKFMTHKTDDKKYIISRWCILCEKNIEKCNKKQKEIDLDMSNMAKRVDDKGKHSADKSGKSTDTY